MSTVRIACRSAAGIRLDVYGPDFVNQPGTQFSPSTTITLAGTGSAKAPNPGRDAVAYTDVDAALWMSWWTANKANPLLTSGMIYGVGS